MEKTGRGFKDRRKGMFLHTVCREGCCTLLAAGCYRKIREISRKRVYTLLWLRKPLNQEPLKTGKILLWNTCLAYALTPLHLPALTLPITQFCSQGQCIARSRHRASSKSTFRFPHPFNIKSSNWRYVWHKIDKNRYYTWFWIKGQGRDVETRQQVSLTQETQYPEFDICGGKKKWAGTKLLVLCSISNILLHPSKWNSQKNLSVVFHLKAVSFIPFPEQTMANPAILGSRTKQQGSNSTPRSFWKKDLKTL